MKKNLLPLFLFLVATLPICAATNFVILGDDFQAKIEAALPNDTLVVQAGVYSGNINFTKPLAVVCSGTNGIQFSGNTTFSAAGTVSLALVSFLGTIQGQTNANVILVKCGCSSLVTFSGGAFQAFDCQINNMSSTGGGVVLKRCVLSGSMILNSASFEAMRLTATGDITANAAPGSGLRLVLTQCGLSSVNATGYSVWLGYNFNLAQHSLIYLTDCNSTLVGNLFALFERNCCPGDGYGVITVTRGTVKAYNNRILLNDLNYSSRNRYGFWLVGASGEIINNSVDIFWDFTLANRGVGTGALRVSSGGGPVKVIANAFESRLAGDASAISSEYVIFADAGQINNLSYCCIRADGGGSVGGAAAINTIISDPQLNTANYTDPFTALSPSVASPCQHAGPPDAIFNNTDGTRNTIGHTGGPYWNPANYTNDSPMVFFVSGTPQTVLKGVQTNILVNVGASAGH